MAAVSYLANKTMLKSMSNRMLVVEVLKGLM